MNKSGKQEAGKTWMDIMADLLKGSVIALGVTLLVTLICSAAVSGQFLSQDAMNHGVTAACVLGVLVGGVAAAYGKRELSLVLSLGVSATVFLILLTAGALLYEEAPILERALTILLACLCGGGIAGILSRGGKKKRTTGRAKRT